MYLLFISLSPSLDYMTASHERLGPPAVFLWDLKAETVTKTPYEQMIEN